MHTPSRGMVLGKFYPPHLGHLYLVDFARHYVDELAVVVETARHQSIPGELRFQWMRELCAHENITVLHLTDENPQDPSEHPDFWQIWNNSLRTLLPWQLNFVFASEDYGWKLAETLGAQFVPVDIARSVMPVSGTEVRTRPLANWKFIPRPVRPYFALRVCIFGPESTGKSTLTQRLADHFQTEYVPEYARTHLEPRNGEIQPSDIDMIARGQMASEDALVRNSNQIMFCDTDLLATTIWSEWLYGSCPDWIKEEANHRTYDLYLVTDVDVPWVSDCVRYLPEERKSFLNKCLSTLQQNNRPYRLLSGSWETRFQTAVDAVQELLKEQGYQ